MTDLAASLRAQLLVSWRSRAKLWAEGAKLWAEGAKLWAEGVLAIVGNVTIQWRYRPDVNAYDCTLGTDDPLAFTVEDGQE